MSTKQEARRALRRLDRAARERERARDLVWDHGRPGEQFGDILKRTPEHVRRRFLDADREHEAAIAAGIRLVWCPRWSVRTRLSLLATG